MKHSFIDKYSGLHSFVHRLDPRTKLLASLVFMSAVVLTPANNWRLFSFYLLLAAGLVLLSRLPLSHVLKRSLVIFPFVLMTVVFVPFFREGQVLGGWDIGPWHIVVTFEGLAVLVNVLMKSLLCILCLIVLSSTTRFEQLLRGMLWLKVPRVLVEIISFMYRYIFVIADQAMRMQIARESRNFGRGHRNVLKATASIVGILFIRSYERAERIYAAMVSRGYDGRLPLSGSLRFSLPDACFALALLILLICPAILWW